MTSSHAYPFCDAVSGGTAAVAARLVVAPIERVKILYQVEKKHASQGIISLTVSIYRNEGVGAYWKGIGVALFRIAPYMGFKFMALEQYKILLSSFDSLRNANTFLAGSLAGVTATALTYPMDLMRCRMAVSRAPTYGYRDMCRHIVSEKGYRSLFAGAPITLKAIAVHDGVKFGTYDSLKGRFVNFLGLQNERDLSFLPRVLSGAFAGALAQTVCYPTDILRRRVQISDAKVPPYAGIYDGVVKIYRAEGVVHGLYRGWTLNLLRACPNIAIYMVTYDYLSQKIPYWVYGHVNRRG